MSKDEAEAKAVTKSNRAESHKPESHTPGSHRDAPAEQKDTEMGVNLIYSLNEAAR